MNVRRHLGVACLAILLAAVIYHPWVRQPLDLWDFREFLPILDGEVGWLARFRALLAYYASHGRSNPAFYATFVAQHAWFGTDALGWQWIRWGWMALNVVLVAVLAARLGIGLVGTMFATGLLVVATPFVRAWVQLMAEPQATAMLLLAALLALEYRRTSRPVARGGTILVLLLLVFLTKEVVGVLGAIVVLLAAASASDDAAPPWRSRRVVVLALGAMLVAAAAATLLVTVRQLPQATGYGMAYGAAPLSGARLLENIAAIMLPVRTGLPPTLALLYPANLLVLVVVLVGAMGGGWHRVRVPLALLAALTGALVYWPWPKFDSFYAMPFAVAWLLVIAAAADRRARASARSTQVVLAAGLLAVGWAAIPASRSVATAAASLRLNDALVTMIAGRATQDTVVILGPPEGPRALPVRAAELADQVVALRRSTLAARPVVRDASCDAAVGLVQAGLGRTTLASYSYGCGPLPGATVTYREVAAYRDWLTLGARADTLTVTLLEAGAPR